ncbi:MAG: hypothetical protein WCI12_00480 [Actinomycetes bacterium]
MSDSGLSPVVWLAPGTLILTSGSPWREDLGRWCESLSARGVSGVFLDGLVLGGTVLDPFTVAGGLSASVRSIKIGVSVHLGKGRAASVAIREATCVDLIANAGSGVLLCSSSQVHLDEGSRVAAALLVDGLATVEGSSEHVAEAPNRPGPLHGGDFEIIAMLETLSAPLVSRISGSDAAIEVKEATDAIVLGTSSFDNQTETDVLLIRSDPTPLELPRLTSDGFR